jgi:site-specific DNA recombinase
MYLNNGGEPSPDKGGGSPSYFISRRVMMINPMDIKICI